MSADTVAWHDTECGAYRADVPLWRELAASAGEPILDVGAGTGRVTLDLAGAGHEVTALDRDEILLDALRARAAALGLEVGVIAADARDFDAGGTRFALCIVPMQTIQLLEASAGRRAFLRCAACHLVPGGLLAVTIADPLDGFDGELDEPPPPDMLERDGWVYSSRPVAVRAERCATAIERVRRAIAPDGRETHSSDVVRLERVDPPTLAREAFAAGLIPEPPRVVLPTAEHVGSAVVMLRA